MAGSAYVVRGMFMFLDACAREVLTLFAYAE